MTRNSVYQPETVWNYEIGVKSYFPDHRLLLNASVYYYTYVQGQHTAKPHGPAPGLVIAQCAVEPRSVRQQCVR